MHLLEAGFEGDGRPLVILLHGFPELAYSWRRILPALVVLGGAVGGLGTGLVRAATFHSAALRQLNYFWPRVVGGRPPQVIDAKAALVREAAKLAKVRLDGSVALDRGGTADVITEIEWAKVTGVRPDGYGAAATAAFIPT